MVTQAPATIQSGQLQQENQADQMSIDGIVDAKSYYVDDFIKQYSTISSENIELIKESMHYDKLIDAFGRKYARITFVNDAYNKNILYFIDERFHFQQSLVRPTIYKLDLKNNKLNEIYTEKSTSYYPTLVGIKNNQLLFFKKGNDDSPGPCFNLWVDAYEHPLPHLGTLSDYYQGDLRTVQSISTNNIKAGFSNFIVPKEKYDAELALQKDCGKNFNKLNK